MRDLAFLVVEEVAGFTVLGGVQLERKINGFKIRTTPWLDFSLFRIQLPEDCFDGKLSWIPL